MRDERIQKLRDEATRLKSALRHQQEMHRHVAKALEGESLQR